MMVLPLVLFAPTQECANNVAHRPRVQGRQGEGKALQAQRWQRAVAAWINQSGNYRPRAYRLAGKQRALAIGPCPGVNFERARKERGD
jgi:hypothetical protein